MHNVPLMTWKHIWRRWTKSAGSGRHILAWLLPLLLTACAAQQRVWPSALPPSATPFPAFSGETAWQHVQAQVAFGPRIPGSAGHSAVQAYITATLQQAGWQVELQTTELRGYPIVNLVARRDSRPPQIILGAHYDTRPQADNEADPQHRAQPIPGANDGASGVAVLLELARTLPPEAPPTWFVFFDMEDSGNLPGRTWSMGAESFVGWLQRQEIQPQAVVILDMIGDADLQVYYETYSTPSLRTAIWQSAADLGYAQYFIPQERHTILDDHLPFLQAGIPAALVIDFDYPWWHTLEDTPDKVSPRSLQIIGETMLHFLQP